MVVMWRRFLPLVVAALFVVAAAEAPKAPPPALKAADLSEVYRSWLDEVAVLISKAERAAFLGLEKDYQRDAFIDRFWEVRDPYPDTARNELRERWEDRVAEARTRFGDLKEDRSRMLLLNGPPAAALASRCTGTLWPLEVWFYNGSERIRDDFALIFVRRFGQGAYRLWHPADGLNALTQLGGAALSSPDAGSEVLSIVRNSCQNGDQIAAGIAFVLRQGMLGFMGLLAKLETPPSAPKGEWVSTFAAYSTDLPEGSAPFRAELTVSYPARRQSRTVVQGVLSVPAAEAGKVEVGGRGSYNFLITGEVLRGRRLFEAFRYKYDFPAAAIGDGENRLPMVFERYLRAGEYALIVKVEDLNAHRYFRQQISLVVPNVEGAAAPAPVALDAETTLLIAEANATITSGENTIRILRPPVGDLMTGLVRFDTLTTGAKPTQVTFSLNGKPILSKRNPPYGVELDLGSFPRVHVLQVRSLDAQGTELASNELRINTNPNRFAVRFVEPKPGRNYRQSVRAEVDVEVPEGESLERVELFLDETRVATLFQPPYTQILVLPSGEGISYLRAVAYLPDGNFTERVTFINAPEYLEQVDVAFVELFTSVVDKNGRPISGLGREDFRVAEDGTAQEIVRFEKVEDLPVHVEVMLDTSASMEASLEDARQAALRFLDRAIDQRDRAAVVTFNDRPSLTVKLTKDKVALAGGLTGLKAERGTALYDSLIFGLYYLSAVKGQRALLVLSDGKDESSRFSFDDSLDYARRTGIAIYSIGLGLGRGERDARKKLMRFSAETGGLAFFIDSVDQLNAIYDQILEELRSKYYLAYQSSNTVASERFRTVDVKVQRQGAEAKTLRGYYP
jgi:Ca-activated chloride channel family protein